MNGIKTLIVISLCIFFLSIADVHAQLNDYQKQRIAFTTYNIGFNGLIGGVGRSINKRGEEPLLKSFVQGFYRGAIGGAVSHLGFTLTHQIAKHENIGLAWPARLVNSTGSSIIQNAAEGNRIFERLHFNLYITRLDYYPYRKKFTAKIFSSSFYGIAVTSKDASLNIKKSLKTGMIYFESSENFSSPLTSGFATGQVSSIGMNEETDQYNYYDIFAHETMHIMQYDRKVAGNAFLYSANQRWKEKYTAYNFLSKFIYFDLNGPTFYIAYKYGYLGRNIHSCNIYEQEAVHYSNKAAYLCK